MSRELKAKITIDADTKAAERNLKKLGDTSKKSFKAVEDSGASATTGVGKLSGGISKLGTSMGAAALKAGALVGGLAAVTSAFKSAFSAALTQEEAINKLDAALASLGPTADSVSESLQRQATELQKVTTFGDEETIAAQALIAAFVKEEDQIKELTRVTLDFASAKGVSLASAADLITKTFASSTNALVRYGLEVEGTAGSTERLSSLTDALDGAFRGAAEAASQTAKGGLQQLSNILGDISERLAENVTQSEEARRAGRSLTQDLGFLNDQLADEESGVLDVINVLGFLANKLLRQTTGTDIWARSIKEATGAVRGFIGPLEDLSGEYTFQTDRVAELEAKQRALTETQEAATKAAKALADEQERYLDVLRELGLISEKATDSLDDNERTLRDVTRAFDEGRISQNQYLDQYERLRTANLNLAEAQRGTVEVITQEEIPAFESATTALQAEKAAIDELREAERARTEDFVEGTSRRLAASAEEAAQRGAGSEFSNLSGGTFTLNDRTVTGSNGRVRLAAGPSGLAVSASG